MNECVRMCRLKNLYTVAMWQLTGKLITTKWQQFLGYSDVSPQSELDSHLQYCSTPHMSTRFSESEATFRKMAQMQTCVIAQLQEICPLEEG